MAEGDLGLLLERLIRSNARFVVIGGYAVMAHGAPLITQDLDVCAPLDYGNARKIADAFRDLNPHHRRHVKVIPIEITPEFCKNLKNLYIRTDIGDIDVLADVPDFGTYEKVEQESIEIELPAGKCRIIGLDALIAIKSAVGRPRDREAVLLLRAIREQQQRSSPTAEQAPKRPPSRRRKRRE